MGTLGERNFDYLIVDYQLNESGCGYNGDDIVKSFSGHFPHFPLILLTTFENGALEEVDDFDFNKIHAKTEINKPEFALRLNRQIKAYRERTQQSEDELELLVERRRAGETLSAEEEQRLLDLDTFLDEVVGRDGQEPPEHLRNPTNDAKITKLLAKTDALLNKLERYEAIS